MFSPLLGRRQATGLRRTKLVAVLAVAALALAAAGCSNDSKDAKDAKGGSLDTVRIAYIGVASWLPAMVAEDQGFFKGEGLDVTSTIVTNLATLPGAMGRQFDLAATTIPDVIKAKANGVGIEAVAGEAWETKDTSIVRLLATPASGVKSVADLGGKKIAAGTLGGNIHPATLHWLAQEGVDTSTVKFSEVAFPQQPAQMKAGVVDAVEALEPFASAMIAVGAVDLGSPLLAVGDPISISNWMASDKWAKSNADVIKRFVSALDKAKAYIASDEAGARKILEKFAKLPTQVADSVKFPTFDFNLPASDVTAWQAIVEEK